MADQISIKEKLLNIQVELKAPKGQRNDFGGYKYRSCEDIVEAVKPLTMKHRAVLTLTDSIELIGDRYYIVARAELEDLDSEKIEMSEGYAREEESKKGMDASQITGSASSYARKYALNGLFNIDDTKDADSQDNTKHTTKVAPKPASTAATQPQSAVVFAKPWEIKALQIQARKILNITTEDDEAANKFLAKELNVDVHKLPQAWVQPAKEKLAKMLETKA